MIAFRLLGCRGPRACQGCRGHICPEHGEHFVSLEGQPIMSNFARSGIFLFRSCRSGVCCAQVHVMRPDLNKSVKTLAQTSSNKCCPLVDRRRAVRPIATRPACAGEFRGQSKRPGKTANSRAMQTSAQSKDRKYAIIPKSTCGSAAMFKSATAHPCLR